MNNLKHSGVAGMKWGERKYRNYDGTLTEEGKKRYYSDVRRNERKKSKDRINLPDEDHMNDSDVDRWVTEDLQRTRDLVTTTRNAVDDTLRMEKSINTSKPKKRMNLDKMTDAELRESINREQLELQYNSLFNKPEVTKVDKGRQYAEKTLEIGRDILIATSTALTIALSIKELRNK